ncbi:MAG: response regulator, partial [Clostridiales bacterium]
MLKVLLIDDEEFIREGLKSIIEWEKYNFKIVGEASDVYEGLKKIDSIKPDIIIANIKMPYMDGLTMTKRLQKISDDYNIIFLTTYSDFKFARKTIELGIYSYLLKPIDETELIEKLINLKDKILSTSRLMKNIITMTKEKYFENYILGVVSKDSIDQYSKILNLDFPWKSYQIALFEIEEYNNRNIKNRNLVKNKIKNEIDLFINKNQFGIIFNIEKYIGVLLKNEP